MTRTTPKLHGHTRPNAERPLVRMITAFVIYLVCIFMMERYGNAGLVLFCRITGIRYMAPYTGAFLKMLGILVVMLIVCLLIHQFGVFYRRRRSFLYGVFVGGYMFLYALWGFFAALSGTREFQDKETVIFSVLYFILVGVTEELVFRGITADLLLQALYKKNPGGQPEIAAVVISGAVFSLVHALNFRRSGASGVLIQMLGVFVLGMMLTAVYYRTANIYAVMVLHAFNDIAAALPVTFLKSDMSVADVISGYGLKQVWLLIPYLIVLVFLLRKKKRREIRELWV